MTFITRLGNGGIIWILIALLLLFNKDKERKRLAFTIFLALIIEVILGSMILKPIFKRSRPCWLVNLPLLIKNPRDYSFPSGHSASSFAASYVIYKYKKSWGILSFVLATLIGFSRLYHFVHFPTDVLGGIILGIGSAEISLKILRRIQDKLMKEKKLPSKN